MNPVTIIGFDPSTYTRSVRMACVEKDVPYELTSNGMTGPGDLKSEPFLAHNPFGLIPVLRHGDVTLFETMAICRYIDRAFDGPPLVPADTLGEAIMEQWASALACTIDRNLVRRYVIEYAFPKGPDGAPDRQAIDAALPDVRRDLGCLNDALASGPFISGDAPSIADFMLLPMIDYVSIMPEGTELMADAPHVARFRDAFSQRPSYAETLPERLKGNVS
jgi:glutathione S-transferase